MTYTKYVIVHSDKNTLQELSTKGCPHSPYKYASIIIKNDPLKPFIRIKSIHNIKYPSVQTRVPMAPYLNGIIIGDKYNHISIYLGKGAVIDRDIWDMHILPMIRLAGREYSVARGKENINNIPDENLGNNVIRVYV